MTSQPEIESPKNPSLATPESPRKSEKKQKFKPSLLHAKNSVTPDLLDTSTDAFSSDISDSFIALGNSNGLIEIFDRQAPYKRLFHLCNGAGRGEPIMSIKFTSEFELVTGDTAGNLCLYDLSNATSEATSHQPKSCLDEFEKPLADDNLPSSGILASKRSQFLRDSPARRLSRSSTMAGTGMSTENCSSQASLQEKFGITCLDYNQKNTIAAIGMDRSIRLYDVKNYFNRTSVTKRQIFDLSDSRASVFDGHTKTPHCVKFIDEDLFVTSGWDDCLKVWDRRSPTVAAVSINGTHVCGPSIDVMPGSDGKIICVGNWRSNNGLQIWDLRKAGNSTAENLNQDQPENLLDKIDLDMNRNLPNLGHFIYTVRFLNPTTVLAGGSGDGPLMAVNVQSKEVVDTLTFGKRGINTISVCAENIVVGGSKGAGKFIPI